MGRARKNLLSSILKIAFIFFAALVVFLVASFFILRMVVRGKEAEVPDVIGKDFPEASVTLADRGFDDKIAGYKYSPVLPKGYVVEQDPMPNKKAKVGRKVKVFLSKGSEAQTVPRVIGQTVSESRAILEAAGLEVDSIVRVHSDSYPQEGTVISHTPLPDTTIQRGSKVNLLVSLGPHSLQLVMPNLIGMKLENALRQIESIGLKQGRITHETSPVVEEPGIVLEQTPSANERIEKGTLVNLVVNSGEASEETPRLVVLRYKVPRRSGSASEDMSPRRVKIMLEYAKGARLVVDKEFAPDEWLEYPVQISGRVIAKFYVDNMEAPVAHKEL